MITSRKVEDLLPELQKMCWEFLSLGGTMLTSTYRDDEAQDALYAIGRTKPGRIVTKLKGGQSMHNHRRAFDFVIMRHGKPIWDSEDYAWYGKKAQELGLVWGGSWSKFKDVYHCELPK